MIHAGAIIKISFINSLSGYLTLITNLYPNKNTITPPTKPPKKVIAKAPLVEFSFILSNINWNKVALNMPTITDIHASIKMSNV